jgi:hypothetical protein
VPPGDVPDLFELRLCVADDGSRIACRGFANLWLLDQRRRLSTRADSKVTQLVVDRPYRLDVEHDGTLVRASLDGSPVAELQASGRAAGFLELCHHTDRPFALRRLTVEGTLDAAVLASVRAAWLKREVAALSGP